MNLQEIGFEVSRAMLGGDIPDEALYQIVNEALSFPIPLKQLDNDLFVLELFHGPTLAFKDVGARFMAGLFQYFLKDDSGDVIILVATSGDTGSAVANAFYNIKGVKVVILYPSGKVSPVVYYMEKNLLDPLNLSMMAGIDVWRVKWHFRPGVFKRLPNKILQKYADAFNISVDQLKNENYITKTHEGITNLHEESQKITS